MTGDLPQPPIAPEIDLRDFGFMPLDVKRLLTSETWIEAIDDPRIGHAAMSLWCESWHQVPAGSIPDNDRVLYRLSMCPSQKEWKRVRESVLRGWIKASDGRLYHRVVVEKAIDSWERKQAQRERTRLATEARLLKRRESVNANDVQRNDPRNVQRNEERRVHQGTGTGNRQGKEQTALITPPVDNSTSIARAGQTGAAAAALRALGVEITPANPLLLDWLGSGATEPQLAEAVARARLHKPAPERIPARYLDPIVREVLAGPQARAPTTRGPAWWTTEQATTAKAAELGLYPRGGEGWSEFRERIRAALAAKAKVA